MKNTIQTRTFSNRFFAQVGVAVFALAFAIAPALSHAAILTHSLGIGSTGADVSQKLQLALINPKGLIGQIPLTACYLQKV